MDHLADNLRFLRKRKSVTQEQIAQILDLKKSTYASYENDDGNTPPAKTLLAIAQYFEVSMESLFNINYSVLGNETPIRISDREIYFPVSVDLTGTELIDVVPGSHQAQAGYISDYSDPQYIQSLPKINWDFGTYEHGTKRIFQISGDSMLPVPSQSFVLTVKRDYSEIINDFAYILVTHHDILFKRIQKKGPQLHLLSDNPLYTPQNIDANDVKQYWQAIKVIMDVQDPGAPSLEGLYTTLEQTKTTVEQILKEIQRK